MRTWCYLVAAILAVHVSTAFAGGYLRVTGPAPLSFQARSTTLPPSATVAPATGLMDGSNTDQAASIDNDGVPPCSTKSYDGTVAIDTVTIAGAPSLTETNSSAAIVVEAASSTPTSSQDRPAEQPPLTSQVLAEIFRHTTESSTNPSTTVVLPAGFMPPPPTPTRSSSATYTEQ